MVMQPEAGDQAIDIAVRFRPSCIHRPFALIGLFARLQLRTAKQRQHYGNQIYNRGDQCKTSRAIEQ